MRRFSDRLLGAHGTDATTAAAATTLGVRSPKVRPKVMLGIVSVKRESSLASLWESMSSFISDSATSIVCFNLIVEDFKARPVT